MKKLLFTLVVGFLSLISFFTLFSAAKPAVASGLSIDQTVTTQQTSASSTISSPALTTTQGNELLLAFVTSDGLFNGSQSISNVTGGGLTWSLLKRVNTQQGTSEVWKAVATNQVNSATITATRSSGSYMGAITVISFTNADLTTDGATGGANGSTGAPSASITTTRDGSWVFGVGNDWDNATARTIGSNQTMIDEFLASVGDTFWTQRQTNITTTSGTSVTINDTAPTTDQWNLAVVEVLPAATPTATPTPTNSPTPTQAPTNTHTPILVIIDSSNHFTEYYPEILHAEGLNEFTTADIASVSAGTLANYDVVILGEMSLNSTQVTTLTDWVNGGGNLIAMKPDKQLAGLLGVTDASSTLSDKYLLVDTSSGPGVGIVNQTIQFHSTADLYTVNGATSLATLYSASSTATTNPAVTMKSVGSNGGHAVAFTYDLAKSVIYTHQGNPSYAGQSLDSNSPPVRADNMFQQNYLDMNKVAIPQADEQQRLLANIITQLNLSNKPMPKFWYLPKTLKAAIVYTLDDHNTASGTTDVFNKLAANSPSNCSVSDWECFRGTSWFYLGIPLTSSQSATYNSQGFEMGVHVENGCQDFTSFANLDSSYTTELANFQAAYPSIPAQTTHRFHCIVWTDWLTQAKVERSHDIRYSMDYYYWPQAWVNGRPGLFTGSGIPMRFADTDGSTLDIYQGVSQLVNENGIAYNTDVYTLLNNATGTNGYYGFFGTHDDYRDSTFSDSIITAAQTFNVPIITAKQALTWLDGRNNSSFSSFSWNGNTLNFTISADSNAQNLQAMLPMNSANNGLTSITRNGSSVSYTQQTIKGVYYAFFPAVSGSYTATYSSSNITPTPTPQETTHSLWSNTIFPNNPSATDTNAVEVGTKFKSDVAGQVTGIKFYKGTGNTGTHVGHLWTTSGTLLATVTFNNETTSGWQQATLDTPVTLSANTTYVVSYHAPNGHYAADLNYLNADYDNAPLHAPSSGNSSGNGIYAYGSAGTFPINTFSAANYWVDVIFEPESTATPTPTATATPTPTNTPTPTPVVTTIWPTSVTPANPDENDSAAVQVGVKFTSDVAGQVTGIKFYKGTGNTGTHTGSLWSASGTRLATATFSNETSSGWQQVTFTTPITISANTTYIASYFAPNGHYANDNSYFTSAFDNTPLHALASGSSSGNGVYVYGSDSFPSSTYQATNYWVDPIFQYTVSSPTATPTPTATVTPTPTATPTPTPSSGISSIWSTSTTPATPQVNDPNAVELGVKFTSEVNGQIKGMRFYKGTGNTGTHIGNLWSSTGTLLASVTFDNETSSGWQEANFSSPVTITANTTYVASYYAPAGNYAANGSYFTSAFDNAPLHALASGSSGGNGVYVYGSDSFPSNTYNSTNYWVDVIFQQ